MNVANLETGNIGKKDAMRPTFAEIRSRFEAERQAAGRLRSASDLPRSYEEISPQWLTRVLADDHPGAGGVGVEVARPLAARRQRQNQIRPAIGQVATLMTVTDPSIPKLMAA